MLAKKLDPFALLKAAHEQDVALAVHELRQWLNFGVEVTEVNPVGTDVVVAGQVLGDEVLGRRGNRNFTVSQIARFAHLTNRVQQPVQFFPLIVPQP